MQSQKLLSVSPQKNMYRRFYSVPPISPSASHALKIPRGPKEGSGIWGKAGLSTAIISTAWEGQPLAARPGSGPGGIRAPAVAV